MSATRAIRERIEARISHGQFLANLLRVARRDSSEVQEHFVSQLTRIGAQFREILENNALIGLLPYRPAQFWPQQRGAAYAFIDAGVASIDLPSAAPVGIRVGSYVVRPGDVSEGREKFCVELALVDDLYSPDALLYEDDFTDLAKLRDVARMTSEVAAALRLATPVPEVDAIILHGPLVNPVAPYGQEMFPPFTCDACRTFRNAQGWDGSEEERHFIATYLDVLERLSGTKLPVYGVVERSVGREPVVAKALLRRLVEKRHIKETEFQSIMEPLSVYGLNDTALLDIVLGGGEYTIPMAIDRQGPQNKWPDYPLAGGGTWKAWIKRYPKALTSYLKPADAVTPFRVETFEGNTAVTSGLDLILHTSRLLPSYGFPVGLDIVDKFAKVPAWMSRSVKGQHQVILIRKALQSGDPRAIAFAKRVLAARGRDWLFRPQS